MRKSAGRRVERKLGEAGLLPDVQRVARRAACRRCVYFEAKNRSWSSAYQCPAKSSAVPAIESLISSIVMLLVLDLGGTAAYLGAPRLNFKGRVTLRRSRIRVRKRGGLAVFAQVSRRSRRQRRREARFVPSGPALLRKSARHAVLSSAYLVTAALRCWNSANEALPVA
jgi:hypothetical protein